LQLVGKHWRAAVGLAGAMLLFESFCLLSSLTSTLLYYVARMGAVGFLLSPLILSPALAAALALLGTTGCLLLLHFAVGYVNVQVAEKFLVFAFLTGAAYMILLSLTRLDAAVSVGTMASIQACLSPTSLGENPYYSAMILIVELSPPSSCGVSLGLNAGWQYAAISGNSLLVSSLFFLLLAFLSTLSVFLKGWSLDVKVFCVTGSIASILAAISEFSFPLSLVHYALDSGYPVLSPSLFGGEPLIEGASFLILGILLAYIAFSPQGSSISKALPASITASTYAISLIYHVILLANLNPITFTLSILKVVTGVLILLISLFYISKHLYLKS